MTNPHVDQSWLALRVTYGLAVFMAGLNNFSHLLTHAVSNVAMPVSVLILTRWRDAALAVGARTLARITDVREPVPVRSGTDVNAARLHAEA